MPLSLPAPVRPPVCVALSAAGVSLVLDLSGGRPDPSSFIDGFQVALRVSAVFALIGAVVAVTTIRKHRHMDAGELAEAAVGGA